MYILYSSFLKLKQLCVKCKNAHNYVVKFHFIYTVCNCCISGIFYKNIHSLK